MGEALRLMERPLMERPVTLDTISVGDLVISADALASTLAIDAEEVNTALAFNCVSPSGCNSVAKCNAQGYCQKSLTD